MPFDPVRLISTAWLALEGGAHWGLAMRAARIATLVVAQEQCGIYPVTETQAMEAARHS
jgi:hypothetical protein